MAKNHQGRNNVSSGVSDARYRIGSRLRRTVEDSVLKSLSLICACSMKFFRLGEFGGPTFGKEFFLKAATENSRSKAVSNRALKFRRPSRSMLFRNIISPAPKNEGPSIFASTTHARIYDFNFAPPGNCRSSGLSKSLDCR